MSYYLLDHRNPHGEHFYRTRRRCSHGHDRWHLGVLHSTEQDADLHGIDGGAEAIARYAASTPRQVSWAASTDSDSTVEMLPPHFTGWHVRGYNRCGLGVEQSYRAHTWASLPAGWRSGTIEQTARYFAAQIRAHPDRRQFRLDRPLTKAEADRGKFGLVAHATLDPGRRSDPGSAYDWDQLLDTIRGLLLGRTTTTDQEDDVQYVRIEGDGRMFAFTGGGELVALDYNTFKAGGQLLRGRKVYENPDVIKVGRDHWLAELPRRNP